jgi:hypothetical protein
MTAAVQPVSGGLKAMSQSCPLKRRPVALLSTLVFSAVLAGCNPTAVEPEPPPGLTGLSIALRFDSQSDTAAIRYRLLRKSCSGEAFTPLDLSVDKPLEDILLPGGIPGFEDQPLDGSSSHAFADLFLDLPPGCYDISTQPLRRDGSASQDCAPASASNVRINDGRTTELFLINQCRGDGRGAIDVISALNHPPALTAVAFERSKFVQRCEEQVVCATAKDPDNDPIEFTWQKVGGAPLLSGPTVVRTTTNPDGSTTQCVRAVAEQTGQYQLAVTVYDLLHDPRNAGRLIRFEEYFARNGSTLRSRAELTFPFYAAANGFTGSCIAPSCKVLLERAPSTPSGSYTLDPDGSGPMASFPAWCDMEADGGGWTLVLKTDMSSVAHATPAEVSPAALASASVDSVAKFSDTIIQALQGGASGEIRTVSTERGFKFFTRGVSFATLAALPTQPIEWKVDHASPWVGGGSSWGRYDHSCAYGNRSQENSVELVCWVRTCCGDSRGIWFSSGTFGTRRYHRGTVWVR